eukprot:12356965-Prorocentrum_lima.AAC.1
MGHITPETTGILPGFAFCEMPLNIEAGTPAAEGDCGMFANGRLVMMALIGTSKMVLLVWRGAAWSQLRRFVMDLGQCMEHKILLDLTLLQQAPGWGQILAYMMSCRCYKEARTPVVRATLASKF